MMRLLSWNIRHGGGKRVAGILSRIRHHDPDVVVLPEYRVGAAGVELRRGLAAGGWHTHAPENLAPRTNGVLIATRDPETKGRPLPHGREGLDPHRLWEVRVGGIDICGVYMPNYEAKHPYWEAILDAAKERANGLALFVGDFNTGKHERDEAGKTFVSAHYMDRIEKEPKFVDLWRREHPDAREYSWFSRLRKKPGEPGNGFRIDHAFASPELAKRGTRVWYVHEDRDSKLSDHSSLLVEIDGPKAR